MVMASFLFMQRMTELQIKNTRAITHPDEDSTGEISLSEQEAEILHQADNQILLFHMNGPMSFSSAKSIVRRHAGIFDYSVMVLDLSDVPCIDFTSSRAIDDIVSDTKNSGGQIILVEGNQEVHDMLVKQGVLEHIENNHLVIRRIDALLLAQKLLKQ